MYRTCIIAAVSIFVSLGIAQQRTDSDIKHDFERSFIFLTKSLNSADHPDSVLHLVKRLKEFELEFKPFREFLNRAVFPDGYDGLVQRLNTSRELAEHKVHAVQLEKEVAALTAQLQSLTEENAVLRAQLSKAQKELASLKKEITALQEEVRKRDEAVFALVDSLFMKYDRGQITGSDMKQLTILERRNAVASLKRTVQDNMAFVASSSFQPAQLPQILNEQRRFESAWSGLAGKLSKAYLPVSAQGKEVAEITASIVQWRSMTDEVFWKGVQGIFAQEHLPIEKFSSGEEMYRNIMTFINGELSNTADRDPAEQTRMYEAFAYNTWGSKIKPSWIPVMMRNGMFTEQQLSMIDAKAKEWQARIQPVHSSSVDTMLIAAFIAAVAFGAYMGTKKRKV